MSRKVLFFNQCREIGGTDTFLVNLIKYWPAATDELHVQCNVDHKGRELYQTLSAKYSDVVFPTQQVVDEMIDRRKVPVIVKKIIKRAVYYLTPLYFMAATYYLYRDIKKHGYDAVFSSDGGYPAGELCLALVIAAKITKVRKIYLIIHSAAAKPSHPFLLWEYYVVDKLVAWACTDIITVSRACAEQIERARKLRRSLKVIANGIPLENKNGLTLEEKKKRLKIERDSKVIGAIGDYEEGKGHLYLIRSFPGIKEACPSAKLVIIGSSAYGHAQVVKKAVDESRFKDDIILTGYLPNAGEFVECFDVLVLPSIAFESFGISLLEAMLYKKPVIGTEIGGIPEVIGDAGFVVSPKNSDQITEKIVYLFNNQEIANRLGAKGFERLKNIYAVENMAQAYYALSANN